MDSLRLVLLPGLDGTSLLYRGLVDAARGDAALHLVSFPLDAIRSYDELVESTAKELAHLQHIVLVAESFSGPIAVRVAERLGASVVGVVLIASFVENPTPFPAWVSGLVRGEVFRVRPPQWLLRWLLLGRDAPYTLEWELADAISRVSPAVMAARLRAILTLRSPHGVSLPAVPLLYIRASQDRLISRSATLAVASTGARMQVVELDVPHLAVQLAPNEVWRQIGIFVAALQGASS